MKVKSRMSRVKGWLTHEDIELLEEASKRQLKYPKNPAKKYNCKSCSYTWLYHSLRCPVCSSAETEQIK
ncbi:MAG: hypothetical protein J4400_01365 [Candidatus Aenigmarchaeota archaeon]|nr:hypothetical protein [Candidatus Aenigmarchaeota archaeon]